MPLLHCKLAFALLALAVFVSIARLLPTLLRWDPAATSATGGWLVLLPLAIALVLLLITLALSLLVLLAKSRTTVAVSAALLTLAWIFLGGFATLLAQPPSSTPPNV